MTRIEQDDWVLGEEIYKALHRWPVIVLCFLMGSLLGYLGSYVLPSPYEATLPLFVNLNPYRALEDRSVAAFAQADFRNIDDYKHWQMSQLSVLMTSDEYLEETLKRVAADGEFWDVEDLESLRGALRLSWRNAGEWKMTAQSSDPERAENLVAAWRQVSLEKINAALKNSRELYQIERELRSLEDSILSNRIRRSALIEVQKSLNQIADTFNVETGSQDPSSLKRERIWALTASVADGAEGWNRLLDSFPPLDAGRAAYQNWIDRALLLIHVDLELLEGKLAELEGVLDQVNKRWEETLQASQGLSPTLAVEVVKQSDASARRTRTSGTAMLAGGTLGILAWGILVVWRISRRSYR